MNAPKSPARRLEMTTGKAFPVYTDKKSTDEETWSKGEIPINAGDKWNALHKLLECDKNLQMTPSNILEDISAETISLW